MNHCHFSRYVVQDFYEDIFEELSKYGEIENLNVCDNLADHMVTNLQKHLNLSKTWPFFSATIYHFNHCFTNQHSLSDDEQVSSDVALCGLDAVQIGNVFVKFREEEYAAAALNALNGRFYAGVWSIFLPTLVALLILLSGCI
jgi:hypothetical protein